MAFRLRHEARSWFSALREKRSPGFEIDFDAYYFCFVAGIAANRKMDLPNAETVELVDAFPGKYRSRGKVLIALFLSQELTAAGVEMEEKATVHSLIARLVDPMSPSSLSAEGQVEFNRYAHGGFDVLRDWFIERPRSAQVFARTFKRKLDEAIQP